MAGMLAWNAALAVGIAELDSDHQQLFEDLNSMEAAVRRGESISGLLTLLECHAKQHFKREESYMARVQCPTEAINRAEHDRFLILLTEAKVQVEDAPTDAAVAAQIHARLCAFVADHILRVDGAMRSNGSAA